MVDLTGFEDADGKRAAWNTQFIEPRPLHDCIAPVANFSMPAELERRLWLLVTSSNKKSGAMQTAGIVQALRRMEPSPLLAKVNLQVRDKLADKVDELLPIRADIVHSQMLVRRVDDDFEAKFVNIRQTHERHPQCRTLTAVQIDCLAEEASHLAEELKNLNKTA